MRLLFFLGLSIPFTMFAQIDMNVNNISGGNDVLKIVNNNQITFQSATENDVMYVKKKDGTTDIYKLPEVNYIVFDGITGVEDYITSLFKIGNYPNPFEQKTTIAFTLEKSSKVELAVFDMYGNIVKALLSGFYVQGEHKVDWDGSNSEGKIVSPDIYFCQLKMDNQLFTKKMIIIK